MMDELNNDSLVFEYDTGEIQVIYLQNKIALVNNLENFIKDIDKCINIDIKEDIENNETTLIFKDSTTLSPLIFSNILSDKQKEIIYKHNLYVNKLKSRNTAKSFTKNRYKIGDILSLRAKIKDGSSKLEKIFEVKKIIWSVKGNPVNVLILKQLSGTNTNRSLTKGDCLKYHIKYEPGLQVYSMLTNFTKRKRLN